MRVQAPAAWGPGRLGPRCSPELLRIFALPCPCLKAGPQDYQGSDCRAPVPQETVWLWHLDRLRTSGLLDSLPSSWLIQLERRPWPRHAMAHRPLCQAWHPCSWIKLFIRRAFKQPLRRCCGVTHRHNAHPLRQRCCCRKINHGYPGQRTSWD
ncbi:hypothetical protein N658DRAFT_55730 [Parathielavia hyrcaniae]|uniref:Uncharacterized protein n=1 Tax=Parathielavia hyrcaniae TaxID=113614 RepID=A0AAN6PVH4_9PEZI|nr:hypothetical protein N658DRAFT_55730 [Parathielavia hyrcaniae]